MRAVAILRAFDADTTADEGLEGASVHLQPIIALGRDAVSGPEVLTVEALARWSHLDVGAILPDELSW